MSVPRRTFLKSGAMAAIAASILVESPITLLAQKSDTVGGYYAVPFEAQTDRVYYFTKATFDPYIGTEFKVGAGRALSTLRLISVEESPTSVKGGGESFSLMFHADKELSIVRTIHLFEHGALGEFNLFVSPTKRMSDPDGIYYVAVINHQNQVRKSGPRTLPLAPRPAGKSGRRPEIEQ